MYVTGLVIGVALYYHFVISVCQGGNICMCLFVGSFEVGVFNGRHFGQVRGSGGAEWSIFL